MQVFLTSDIHKKFNNQEDNQCSRSYPLFFIGISRRNTDVSFTTALYACNTQMFKKKRFI
jgi:hypothetical protein